MTSLLWWAFLFLGQVRLTSADLPEDGPRLHPKSFITDNEFLEIKNETESYEHANTKPMQFPNQCLETCDAEHTTVAEHTTSSDSSDSSDPLSRKRRVATAGAPNVPCPQISGLVGVCDFHACCASTYSYQKVTTAIDMYGLPVTIVQIPPNYVQGFFIEKCTQQLKCRTICSCMLKTHFHRAVVIYQDGNLTDTHVGIPTSCKCYNI